ncbi:DUF898 family protein [Paraclostridium bifermentans]|jgi:uncharacterized membrane protein YjgN (DUF898 family)|uniref:DUF898 domain-containing protein n=1 Tax=Paraclostridium bifermentans ATCC 638 = DSM 14991 TaxID=1233171 RepID=T4VN73_PARBF|nr:DUF898 family protein [Paraclostridium bifermentans]RDC50201.1 DUF898 family protein [Acinetobacter sp. RIT592]EQK42211.1 hypothetical protein C672_1153 [[Clostridium] bifermentans ATCC 638] [Paraclostridium bifermentans ATCC 638 = DSM 14991]MBS5952244.1 DUF898 family protein [Paraclostridium bifermentans]MBU5287638.1 DUF898 domain-containing protein [Paraclostridium bifermentans]MDU3335293.1 DUF898 family protein [Paraclostridium bifermentans]
MKSRFEGNILGFIGVNILAAIITLLTLGIATPWAMCIKYRWEIDNTTIDGKRLQFIGTGGDLFVHYIKWWVLTIITFGIYGFWLYINLIKWRVENTEFIN